MQTFITVFQAQCTFYCTQWILSWYLKSAEKMVHTLATGSERNAPLVGTITCLQTPQWPEMKFSLEGVRGTETWTKENMQAVYNPVRNR